MLCSCEVGCHVVVTTNFVYSVMLANCYQISSSCFNKKSTIKNQKQLFLQNIIDKRIEYLRVCSICIEQRNMRRAFQRTCKSHGVPLALCAGDFWRSIFLVTSVGDCSSTKARNFENRQKQFQCQWYPDEGGLMKISSCHLLMEEFLILIHCKSRVSSASPCHCCTQCTSDDHC